jgi:DedD protein
VVPPAAPPPDEDHNRAAREAEAARVRALLNGGHESATAAAATYVVQIGAFSDAIKAASIVADLKQQGFAAYTEKVGTMTRVRVGPASEKSQGEQMLARMKALGHGGSTLARH